MGVQYHNKYLETHGADINRSLTEEKKAALIELLYPQYDDHFAGWRDYDKVLSREEAEWLREQAYIHLSGNLSGMSDQVRSRMMNIVGGYFPIGFIGWWEVPDKF